jgi:hypothetical protein
VPMAGLCRPTATPITPTSVWGNPFQEQSVTLHPLLSPRYAQPAAVPPDRRVGVTLRTAPVRP